MPVLDKSPNQRLNGVQVGGGSSDVEIVHPLQIKPVFRRDLQRLPDTQCGVCRDGTPPAHNFTNASRRYANRLGKAILSYSQLLQYLSQVFTGMNRMGTKPRKPPVL